MTGMAIVTDEQMPCCDYRDHGGNGCACPEHLRSVEHPFGYESTTDDLEQLERDD